MPVPPRFISRGRAGRTSGRICSRGARTERRIARVGARDGGAGPDPPIAAAPVWRTRFRRRAGRFDLRRRPADSRRVARARHPPVPRRDDSAVRVPVDMVGDRDSPCVLCGTNGVRVVYPIAPDYITCDLFRVVACEGCGLVRTEVGPACDSLHRYYGPAYYGSEWGKLRPVIESFLCRRSREWARRIADAWQVTSVLDVGCGRGDLLRSFHELGAECVGLESDDAPHWILSGSTEGIEIRTTGDAAKWPVAEGGADLVIFRHTLEHFPDPVQALREARRSIRPEGRMIVVVPDFSSLQSRFGGEGWLHLDVPRHCYHFGADTLSLLLGKGGFAVQEWRAGELHQDLFGWLQTVGNKLTPGSANALYRLMQGGPAWESCSGKPAAAVQFIAGGVLSPFWLAAFCYAVLRRRRGTLTAICTPA